jgi:16S rRNA G966 N2-methylase RsmD
MSTALSRTKQNPAEVAKAIRENRIEPVDVDVVDKPEFKIDGEFESLIPPLSSVELEQLEENIKADGCRDALVVWNGILLDGHNRYAICTKHGIAYRSKAILLADRDAAKEWIIRNQFGRRNLTTFARAELALKLKPILERQAKENQRQSPGRGQKGRQISADLKADDRKTSSVVAKAAGVSRETIRAAEYVQKNADEATKAKLRSDPNLKLHRVLKDVKESKQRDARQAKRNEAAKGSTPDSRILVGDFRKLADQIPDGSLPLIFTDPPYDREGARLLPDLAAFAEAKLADGGSLLCYIGQTQLPAAIDAFRKHLRYWWTIACVHSGGSTGMREYGVNNGWKPVLWFVKGTRDNNSEFVSDVMSGGSEKAFHDWQQSQSEAEYWIDKLCPKDGIVCDPFLGGGTTAAAAETLGRRWIGCEINEQSVAIASKRIEAVRNQRENIE